MQKIKFITDTASDIPQKYQSQVDIEVLSFPITIDGVSYLEGVDFSPREFYNILPNAKEIPKTSHITTPTFLECYERAYSESYTHIIVVVINKKGSNTYDAAFMARDFFYEDKMHARERMIITILECETYSLAYGFPLIQAGLMAKRGESSYSIINYLEDALKRVEVVLSISNLEYAKKSGRITTAAAFVGELLGLRPIMRLKNGVISTVSKVRGDGAVPNAMVEEILRHRTKDPKFQDYLILESDNKKMSTDLTKAAKKAFGRKFRGIFDIGSAIVINAGPTVTGVMYFSDNKD